MVRQLLVLTLLLWAGIAHGQDAPDVERARAAYRFGFPVYQMMYQRGQGVARLPPGFNGTNTMFHRATLADHRAREVTTPNNDTLYSNAWLDLSGPPVLLTLPPLPDRFHVVSMLSLFTDNVALLGTRANGGKGGRFVVAGPNWQGDIPPGTTLIRAPTNDVWLIVRMLVDGPDELPTARLIQSGLTVTTLGTAPYRPMSSPASDPTDPQIFLAVVNEALARGPLPPLQAGKAAALRDAGIGVPWESLSPAMQQAWRANCSKFYEELKGGIGWMADGWVYPKPSQGIYGDDDLYRAKVALNGMAALPLTDATYISTGVDEGRMPLDGSKGYRLHIPAKVPVKGFWSLSLYEIAPDGRLFFTDNPLRRYAVGDRTKGLRRNADGSLDITISHSPPVNQANWLPAPNGPFRLTFRGYYPDKALAEASFRLAPVTRLWPMRSAPLLGGEQRGVNAGTRSSRRGKASFRDRTAGQPSGSIVPN